MPKDRISLDPAHHEEIILLREGGWSCAQIARKFGCSVSAIDYVCAVNGVVSRNTTAACFDLAPREYRRNGKLIRRFSDEEDARLRELEGQGLSYTEIGRRMGRGRTSVKMHLIALARRDEFMEARQP